MSVVIFISFKEPNSVKLYEYVESDDKLKSLVKFVSIHEEKEAMKHYGVVKVPCMIREQENKIYKLIGNDLLNSLSLMANTTTTISPNIPSPDNKPLSQPVSNEMASIEGGTLLTDKTDFENKFKQFGNGSKVDPNTFQSMISFNDKLDSSVEDIKKRMDAYNNSDNIIKDKFSIKPI